MKSVFRICVLLCLAQLILGEAIQSKSCTNPGENNPISRVFQVKVEPCPNAGTIVNGQQKPCKLARGTPARISVDFFPKRGISGLNARLVYLTKKSELPLQGLEKDGCKSLVGGQCPLTPNYAYTWSANVSLYRSYPKGLYPLKLKLTEGNKGEKNPATVLCQTFPIELV